ncbi:hypothetical protein PR048_016399 [Dryococelus australis]|uniref:Uncharacterized protein n=1 Tax=Dryococelus australis TaxID=614101 RepID=A0ABQ9HJX9_9NEOP|nr:hypothetical protein PR048_016399 [Dryococelus australis]
MRQISDCQHRRSEECDGRVVCWTECKQLSAQVQSVAYKGDTWSSLKFQFFRSDVGELRLVWISAGLQGEEETGDPRETPPASGIVRHDSHMRIAGSKPAGNRARFPYVEGE